MEENKENIINNTCLQNSFLVYRPIFFHKLLFTPFTDYPILEDTDFDTNFNLKQLKSRLLFSFPALFRFNVNSQQR